MTDYESIAGETFGVAGTGVPLSVARSVSKRTLDIAVALLAILALLPLLAVVALLVWLEDGSPIIFKQTRTGLNGKPFTVFKFRSMRSEPAEQNVRQATKGDSRVTKTGAVLRALSIDELPQLFNILRGDMSLVGPRPHALSHDTQWSQFVPHYGDRFRAKPGLTGYAQVSGLRGEVHALDDVRSRIAADNEYIDKWTIGLDLMILLRTVPLMFHDPRAY